MALLRELRAFYHEEWLWKMYDKQTTQQFFFNLYGGHNSITDTKCKIILQF